MRGRALKRFFAAAVAALFALSIMPGTATAAQSNHAVSEKSSALHKTKVKKKKTKKTKAKKVATSGLSISQCEQVARASWIYLPSGWSITCRPSLPGAGQWKTFAVTDMASKTMVVKSGMSHNMTVGVVAHEQAHIYSFNKLTYSGRTWFANQIGKNHFFDGGVRTMPAEIWAATMAACQGFGNGGYKTVSCSLITQAAWH